MSYMTKTNVLCIENHSKFGSLALWRLNRITAIISCSCRHVFNPVSINFEEEKKPEQTKDETTISPMWRLFAMKIKTSQNLCIKSFAQVQGKLNEERKNTTSITTRCKPAVVIPNQPLKRARLLLLFRAIFVMLRRMCAYKYLPNDNMWTQPLFIMVVVVAAVQPKLGM